MRQGEAKSARAIGEVSAILSAYIKTDEMARKIVYTRPLSGTSPFQLCPLCLAAAGVRPSDARRYFETASKRKPTEAEVADAEALGARLRGKKLTLRRYAVLSRIAGTDNGVVTYETTFDCALHMRLAPSDFERYWCEQPRADAGMKKIISLSGDWQKEFFTAKELERIRELSR